MDHLFVGDSTHGALYDTRVADWSAKPPLRPDFRYTHGDIKSLANLKATLRAGAYAWPGGYPLFFITRDGAAFCFGCAREEFRRIAWDYLNDASTGWRIEACDINYEDPDLYCDHCNGPIESAYGD